MMRATPLLQRPEDAPFAWLSESLNGLEVSAGGLTVSNRQFLAHVDFLMQRLPQADYALNLCDNRYLFAVASCAVILARQTNLLPPNKALQTQKNLLTKYAQSYALHDGKAELPSQAQALDLSSMDWSLSSFQGNTPTVALDHLAIISFTSGSTGESKPNLKYWHTLQESSRINKNYMLPNQKELFFHLATVPGQHMWGLETSILLPLFANACLVDAKPLYPHDILDLLEQIPSPCTVIGTPLHLRALQIAQSNAKRVAPKLANVLCATAPLDSALAEKLEATFETELHEVYGCSEVGSMSVRRTAVTEQWTKFAGLNFTQNGEGDTFVDAEHLPEKIRLEDSLKMINESQFSLRGRATDQVKVAGKRGSLAEVNAILAKFSGFLDGVVFFPPQDRLVPRLVAIVVLEDGSKDDLKKHFARYLDSAFVPRPIYLVESLPREENGKLSKNTLNSLYQELGQGSN